MVCLNFQGGPLEDVKIIKEPSTGRPRGFGFITYSHKCSLPYAMQLFSGTKLYDRELNVRHTHGNSGGTNNTTNSSSRDSPQHKTNVANFPNPYAIASSLQGFGHSHASNSQMLPDQMLAAPMGQLVQPNFGLLTNPMLDPALLEQLGSQLLLTNTNLLLGGGGSGGHDLYKHSGRERRHNWRDEKPYSHHDRARDNYRERDNRSRQGNREHRHHDNRHDNRRRR
jgi:RNA recognition motif-containing protein